ncbi:hypothetical protein OFO03_07940 [Campylobacter sp. JMF_02 ED1]|uniref:hypothetical protein n=1 Tax=unclassified Campylobacter TaxID=2593542 RepID=UPI0022E9C41A|nr:MULTISPECIES: hypothetical protein [unclassified Campylobacter]MDA3050284.1 hypothetical protein [Campylobacter sp. JMF_15 NE4]MDA3051830.1 hypothetical protein [Campylobacter sp. JMF_02 ED1]
MTIVYHCASQVGDTASIREPLSLREFLKRSLLSLRGDAVAVAIYEPKLPCALNSVIASECNERSNPGKFK